MSCRILSVQFWSSSVDVHVLWQETKIEKKRESEHKSKIFNAGFLFNVQIHVGRVHVGTISIHKSYLQG